MKRAAGLILGMGVFLALALTRPALAAAPPNELVKPDPDTVIGALPNGLRYAIKQHPSHQKEVIYFYVAAGSIDETANERGIAHFLEHMAFNGSRSFPADSLIKTFENAGIGFGRDQNAFTNYFGTTFVLNIPNESDDKLSLGFRWLRDVADGLLLTPAEVDRERGVVMSEYRLNLGPHKTLFDDKVDFLIPDLRAAHRAPIGERAAIEHADASVIRGFYQRWYRPENVTIVAVGDEPVWAIRNRIERMFGDWKSSTPPPVRAVLGHVDYQRAEASKSLSDPHISGGVTLCRYSPKRPHQPEDVDVTREALADRIWETAFAKRMVRLARGEHPPFVNASGSYSISYRAAGETCFSASSRVDDWRSAMTSLTAEIGRLERYGVTQREFDEARRSILAEEDAAVAGAPTQTPEPIANAILDNLILGDTFDTHAESRRIYGLAFEGLSPATVSAQFRHRWSDGSPPLVLVSGPHAETEAEISHAFDTALAAAPLPAPVDPGGAPWAYAANGATGAVVKRELIKDPDFVRLTFVNGVVLNFKESALSSNEVDVHVMFGAGQQESLPGEVFDASMVGGILFYGGYKRNDINDVMELCEGHRCNAGLSVGRTSFDLYGSTRRNDLDLELQLLDGLLAEPGFRPVMAAQMPTLARSYYRQIRLSPEIAASLKLVEALPRPHVTDLPTETHIAGLTAADFARMVRTPLTSDPLEVTVVGDIDEAHAIEAIGKTFGALPPRKGEGRPRPDAVHLRLAEPPAAPLIAYHEGPKDQAVVNLTWPLFVWSPAKVHEGRVVTLLISTLQDELTERVRQKLGKSYSPSVSASLPRGGDQGTINMNIQTSPDAVATVQAEALRIVADFAVGHVTQAMLDQARKPLLEAWAKERTYNNWWMSVMDGSARYPDKLVGAREKIPDIRAITLDEVKVEAARWLVARPYVVVALPKVDAQVANAAAPAAIAAK